MVFADYVPPPKVFNVNRALAPWVRRPGVGGAVRCCICQSNQVYHVEGLRDFWLCFGCHNKLIVKEEEKK